MLGIVASQFSQSDILVVTDSWFGNDGFWRSLHKDLGPRVQSLSLLRSNYNLFGLPEPPRNGARWKIEAGFKELKQDIGSAETQSRDPVAVKNHLNFYLMAASLIWMYACRVEKTPCRRHAVTGCGHFAFSDVRRFVAQAALDETLQLLLPCFAQSVD